MRIAHLVGTSLVAGIAIGGTVRAQSSPSTQRPAAPASSAAVTVDDGYILALGVADGFMHAWAARDLAAAKTLLSPAALKKHSAGDLASLIQGTSSPHHQSYEIGPGRKLSAAKYAFDVIEYDYLTGMNAHDPRPTPSQIVVIQSGANAWLVDEFPDK